MYAPQYGYGPNSQQGQQQQHQHQHQQQQHQPGPGGYPNGVGSGQPPQQHYPHQQQTAGLQQPQQQMYNPQAFAVNQSQYGAPAGGLAGNAGTMGMMQNGGLAQQVPAGSQIPQYQTPYTTSPYGVNNQPASSSSNLQSNFMPTTTGPPSYQMNASNMNPPQARLQMQPPPPSSIPVQRSSPYTSLPQHSPSTSAPQSQFSHPTAQPPPAPPTSITTPQTPSFPPGSMGGGNVAAPMSPGSENREKERVTLLLRMNSVLLMESLKLQSMQGVERQKEAASALDSAPKPNQILRTISNDYVECMKRLQANLAYLAAIADRSHKPSSQIPSHPAIMAAPIIHSKLPTGTSSVSDDKAGEGNVENEIKDMYTQLQALFPGIDPNAVSTVSIAAKQKQQADIRVAADRVEGGEGLAKEEGKESSGAF